MRLWSVHPEYLDAKGLVALWREGLLARKVLLGKTQGYRNHPQLQRFRETGSPVTSIESYLHAVVDEADRRDYHFDRSKLGPNRSSDALPVSEGQLAFEWQHLQKKLMVRDPKRAKGQSKILSPRVHPSFRLVEGPVAPWEKIEATDAEDA